MSATSTPITTSKRSSLARNSAISLAVRLLAAVSGLLVTTLITRTLEPAAAGSYFILFSFCSIGAIVVGCGGNLSVVRLVSEAMALGRPAQARGAVRMVLLLLAIASLLFAAVLLLPPVRELLAMLLRFPPDGLLLVLLVVWTVGLALQSVLAEAFRGLQDIFRASVYGGLCTSVLCLTALGLTALYSVPTLRQTITLVAVAALLAALICSLALGRALRRLPAPELPGWRSLLALSLPLWGTNLLLVVLTQADLWILNQLADTADVALYGAASRLTQLLTLPLLVLNSALIPMISEQHALGQHARLQSLLRDSAALAALPAIVALVLFAVPGPLLLELFFGGSYRAAHTVLLILGAGQCINVLCGSAGYALMMTGHQRDMLWITVFSGALLIPLAFVLGDWLGSCGVALGVAIALAVQSVAMCICVRMRLGLVTVASPQGMLHPLRTLKRLL
ncbi:lipopolysaccharide biosynthesis protein [Pseudomonas sp. GD04087]|uniref:lipopolysaccharide biosynthesis protein n=1 Tax=unclassified Pseudomonas TaxID=196821 RepID=UPI00244D710D|nr:MULTISPECIES: lipopolysaccharide biosynthesis protein [unclassified Pseudomonas]MDH0288653.1 lipopolysaccharide biosynthesis protein [Pseudomonas sp. GD04087]MDH1049866.1 lipopolysaccharide biosynthesis protein [Pseudomonas sp. GD03903]MDH1998133.1 lipopolysaccharide biosynthesis protein [Pseudomonas sp. GD03691]